MAGADEDVYKRQDLWSDEPQFAQAAARLGITGICGSGIIEVIAEMYLSCLLYTSRCV